MTGAQPFDRQSSRLPPGLPVDVLVCSLVLALGALQFMLPQKGDDFFRGDTIYIEFARSILERGTYRLEFNDVMYPPGFPALLAFLSATVSGSHAVLVRSMAVFVTLALLASYHLLRRETGRCAAAATCLLLASSPLVFEFSTQWVYSDLPYFFTSMATLVVASRLDRAGDLRARVFLGLLCAATLLSSLLMRSSGVALIAGLAAWLAVGSAYADKATRARRLRAFTAVLLVGVVFQTAWMGWVSRNETVEWPMLEGHPRTYTSQFKVKSGIQPELGTASLTDVMARAPKNVAARAAGLMELMTRKDYIDPAWYSPLVLGSVLLVALGLGSSLRPAGGSLAEWYFIGHEAMYVVWPWPFEMRFLIPVAPLACLYIWRGLHTVGRQAARAPRMVGIVGVVIGVVAGAAALAAAWGSNSTQPKLAAIFWTLVFAMSAWTAAKPASRSPFPSVSWLLRQRAWGPTRQLRLTLAQVAGAAAVTGLIALGIGLQLGIGLKNLQFDVTTQPAYGRIAAARWIDEHTAKTAVVMARQQDVVHHHASRKVVWFAPVSDPQLLLDGIRRLKVDYIIVTNIWNYYLPSEDDSIDALLRTHPQAFRLVHEEARCRIFEVVHAAPAPQAAP